MPRLSDTVLSSLIGDIYDCALDPGNWTPTLIRVTQALDAAYTAISLAHPSQRHGRMAIHSPWDVLRLRELNEEYGLEGVPGLQEVAIGDVDIPRSTLSQMDEPAFQASPFYQNWARPQGLRDACVTKFVHSPERVGVMAMVTRATRDIVSAEERHFVALLSPHIRRAALIGDLLDFQRVELDTHKTMLDLLSTPVILTDRSCRVLHANAAAEVLIRQAIGLTVRNGVITCTARLANTALADAVARSGEAGRLGQRGIGVPLSTAATPAIAYVLPLAAARHGLHTSASERAPFRAAAAIFISNGVAVAPLPEAALIALFDLTPTEARVLCAAGSGMDPKDTATQFNISANTLKTHLTRIYDKTGTSRQADLVKLVSDIAPRHPPAA